MSRAHAGIDGSSGVSFAQNYSEVMRWTPRAIARHGALSIAGAWTAVSGAARRALARPRVHFLYLHHVFADEEAGFRRLLEELAATHAFIDYSEAVSRVRSGEIDRPYVTFSFDDGLKTCLRAGEMLSEHGAQACFFVCPPMAEERDPRRIESFCREKLDMPATEFLSWGDMEALKSQGHEIGSHTMGHPRLSELGREELVFELGRSKELIEERVGEARHFAWPFGRFFHMSSAAAEATFEAGYESCTSAERGAHVVGVAGPKESLCIRRDQIVAAWPINHSLFFMTRSSVDASAESNLWPQNLAPGAAEAAGAGDRELDSRRSS